MGCPLRRACDPRAIPLIVVGGTALPTTTRSVGQRPLDKLIEEPAKGKPMAKILRG
jgi:hypothetical protein